VDSYPYTGRDLFEHPESYEYAACDGPGYIGLWRAARQAARRSLEDHRSRPAQAPLAETPPSDPRSEGVRRLGDLLGDLLKEIGAGGALKDETRRTLDALITKFEVFRRLFALYQPDLRRVADSDLASRADYVLFGCVLAAFAERTGELRYLSTLMKLMDALCARAPDTSSGTEAETLIELIDREDRLIAQWEAETAS
jgi:hypothetical protein